MLFISTNRKALKCGTIMVALPLQLLKALKTPNIKGGHL